jgi:hypothetical protein
MDLETIKRVLFEVYSAGYEQGYAQNEDIAAAYEKMVEEYHGGFI